MAKTTKKPIKGLTVNTDGPVPEIYIYDEIGPSWFGLIGADLVIEALEQIGDVAEICVRINSPGGDVFEGAAIYNALARHPARINVEIDALAASIASVIAMAGDSIRIAGNAMLMIHNAWSFAMGNASELRSTAEVLDQVDGTIVDTYVARTNQTADDVRQWMADETWMNADRAVELGFADEKGELQFAQASIAKDRYKNTPKQFVDATRSVKRDLQQSLIAPRSGRLSQDNRIAAGVKAPTPPPETTKPPKLSTVQARINLRRKLVKHPSAPLLDPDTVMAH